MIERDQLADIDITQLEALSRLFLKSNFYHKAMYDARYERMQAIKEFLLAQSIQLSKAEELEEMALAIRKNYYRFF